MYIHPLNSWQNEVEIIDFINQNAFGTLVTYHNERSLATHLPFILSKNPKGEALLSGHVAKANLQWKSLPNDADVLVIFQGPHAYISSSWYDHENVPTWNYLAVHVYGKIRLIDGEKLMNHLKSLVDTYENGRANRSSIENMSSSFVENQMKALVGFEVIIGEVLASAKLSQNRDKKNYQTIIHRLESSNNPMDAAIAKEMKHRDRKE